MSYNYHGFDDPVSQERNRALNPKIDPRAVPRIRRPDGYIYIHSVAKRSFPKTSNQYFRQEFKGCAKGERYVTCGKISDPPYIVAPDEANGGMRVYEEPGDQAALRVAIDVLNPNNPTLDQYWEDRGKIGAFFSTSANSNLIAQGLFASPNEVPTEAELKRAENARDSRYRKMVDEAMRLEALDPKELQVFLRDNPEVHQAMDELGLESGWHKRHVLKESCPNCGDMIPKGVAFHRSSVTDDICILDVERAAKAGVTAKRGPGRPVGS